MRGRTEVVDDALVLAAQAGRTDAFERLALRWHPRLLRHASRLTGDAEGAREAVQEAWLAIARGLSRLHDPASFGAWAYRIASRRCADWIARRQRLRRSSVGLDLASAVQAPDGERSEELALVRDALRRLEPGRRALLGLLYVEGMSVAEIAQALGVPVGTVKSRLFHARDELRAVLEV